GLLRLVVRQLVRATGPVGRRVVKRLECGLEALVAGDVAASLLLGPPRGLQAGEPTSPGPERRLEHDRDGLAVVGAGDALDLVVAGAAHDRNVLVVAVERLPRVDEVVRADRRAVVPDRLRVQLVNHRLRAGARDLRLSGEQIAVPLDRAAGQED